MTSATSLVTSLKVELADGQRKLVALAESAGATAARAGLGSKQSNGTLRDKVNDVQLAGVGYCWHYFAAMLRFHFQSLFGETTEVFDYLSRIAGSFSSTSRGVLGSNN